MNNLTAILGELHKLIDINNVDDKRRENIIVGCKDILLITNFIQKCTMELNLAFNEEIITEDLPKIVLIIISLKHLIKKAYINSEDMRYIVYVVIVNYFCERQLFDAENFLPIRLFYQNIFDLCLLPPEKLAVSSWCC